MHQFNCWGAGHDCTFVLETGDIETLVQHVQDHVKREHGREVSRAGVEDEVTEGSGEGP